jgi:hypothetical protein
MVHDVDAVWCKFFQPHRDKTAKKAKAGTTLKVYSMSLQTFLEWLEHHQMSSLSVYEAVSN